MVFRSRYETSKWAQIQNQGETSLDKLLTGRALSTDIKALSTLITKQHALAGKIFDEGIAGVEATADTILDKMNRERIELGKRPLTPKAHERILRQTFQKVLMNEASDIIGAVHDHIDEKFDDFAESQQDLLDSAFEKVRKLPGTTEPVSPYSVWRPREPSQSQVPVQGIENEPKAESYFLQKFDSLVALVRQIGDEIPKMSTHLQQVMTKERPTQFDTGRNSILGHLRKDQTAEDKIKPKQEQQPLTEESQKPQQSWLSRVKERVLGEQKEDNFKSLEEALKAYGVHTDKTVVQQVKQANKLDPELAKHNSIEDQIQDALDANEKLRNRANKEWKRIEGDEDDDKKSNTWLRKLKNFVGLGKKKGRDDEKSSFLGNLAKLLILAVASPELIRTISDGVSKYLNFDTISSFIETSWKTIKETGGNILDWIIEQVSNRFSSPTPPPTPASEAAKLDHLTKSITQAKKDLDVAKMADTAVSTDATRANVVKKTQDLQTYQGLLDRFTERRRLGINAGPIPTEHKPTDTKDLVGPKPEAPTTGSSVSLGAVVAPSPATIMNNSSVSTMIVPESKPVFKAGVSYTPQDRHDTGDTTPEPTKAASGTLSMSSFGFNSHDDTLNLLNVGAIG